jgi:hypothetical protein
MNDVPSNFQRLLEGLLAQTQKGKLAWKPEDDDRTVFSVSLPHGGVTILSVDRDGAPPIELSLLDQDGVTVQRARFGGSEDELLVLWNLFQTVRESTNTANIVVDGLLMDLDGLDLPF